MALGSAAGFLPKSRIGQEIRRAGSTRPGRAASPFPGCPSFPGSVRPPACPGIKAPLVLAALVWMPKLSDARDPESMLVTMGDTCTGVVLTHQLVVYAGHCGVDFGSTTYQGTTIKFERCRAHPDPRVLNGNYFAYCLAKNGLPKIAATVATLSSSEDAEFWGYGTPLNRLGSLRQWAGKIEKRPGEKFLRASIPAFGMCGGDSGGPVFVNGRLVGIASSTRRNHICNFVATGPIEGYYTPAEGIASWLREEGFQL